MPRKALIKSAIDDPIDEALDQATEIVRADLLMTARKSGTTPIAWREVVVDCRKQALTTVTV